MKLLRKSGSTSNILTIFILDATSTTGAGLSGLNETSGIVGGYVREGGTGVALNVNENVLTEGTYQAPTLASQVRIGTPVNMIAGTYELHFHDDLFASGAESLTITLGGATNMVSLPIELQIVGFDPESTTNLGLSTLTNNVPQTADHTSAIAAIPTTKTGYSLSATGLDAISQSALGVIEIVKGVWDRLINPANHNIAKSAGKLIRQLQESGNYAGALVWLDTVDGIAGADPFDNGTEVKPTNLLSSANSILAALPLHGIHVAAGSTVTFVQSQTNEEFAGQDWILNLGGQNITGSEFSNATVNGISTGSGIFKGCFLMDSTFAAGDFIDCALGGNVTLSGAAEYHMFNMHHALNVTPIIDYGATVGATILHQHDYHGAVQINNMGAIAGADVLHFDSSGGVLTLDATCVGGTANLSGTFKLVNNSSGMTINLNGTIVETLGVPTGASVSADLNTLKIGVTVSQNLDKSNYTISVGGIPIGGIVAGGISDATTSADFEAAIRDAVWAKVIETQASFTAQQTLSVLLAMLAGRTTLNGATVKTADNLATRATFQYDASNNRTLVTLTPSA